MNVIRRGAAGMQVDAVGGLGNFGCGQQHFSMRAMEAPAAESIGWRKANIIIGMATMAM